MRRNLTIATLAVGSTIAEVQALGGTLISESGASLIYGVDQVTLPAVPDQGDAEVLSVGAFTSGSGAVEWLGAPYSNKAP